MIAGVDGVMRVEEWLAGLDLEGGRSGCLMEGNHSSVAVFVIMKFTMRWFSEIARWHL